MGGFEGLVALRTQRGTQIDWLLPEPSGVVAPVGSGSNQIGWLPLWVFGRMFGFYDMMGDCSEVRKHLRVVPGVVPQTIFSFFFDVIHVLIFFRQLT